MSDHDLLADMVWALVARVGDDWLDEDPEATIARFRRSIAAGLYPDGLAAVAAECQVPWPLDELRRQILTASAWAGRARWALIQRDRAIRAAVDAGATKRAIAHACGLSRPGVDRILKRADAANTRW